MQEKRKGGTVTLQVTCAVLFILFVVSYVFLFQCDVLAMSQYAWSDGQKHYERIIGTVVITVVLVVIAAIVRVLSRNTSYLYALNYYPSLLLLGLLTSAEISEGRVLTPCKTIIWVAFLFVIYVCCVCKLGSIKHNSTVDSYKNIFRPWWINLLLLFGAFFLVNTIGNTNRTLHTRLCVERLCKENSYSQALSVGIPQHDEDSSLVMLRAMALANTYNKDSVIQLGEKLFSYNIKGGKYSLFPQRDKSCAFLLGDGYNLWLTLGFVPYDQSEDPVKILKRQIKREKERVALYNDTTLTSEDREKYKKPKCNKRCVDYLLCAYLLDKNLAEFIKLLPQYYVLDEQMPKHYREACVLYANLMGKPVYKDASVEADYNDYLSLVRTNKDKSRRLSEIRDNYFGTYWYYYYTH